MISPADLAVHVFFKAAAPRYLRELQRGALSLRDKLRLGGNTPASIRKNLATAATDLDPAQLSRHRRLQGLLGEAVSRHEGAQLRNKAMAGPAMANGMVHVSPQAGTQLRVMSENPKLAPLTMAGIMTGRDMPESVAKHLAKPQDPAIYRSILNHERGERAMFHATVAGQYRPNFFASHLGPAADLAERQGVRDPAVHELFDRIRQNTGKDDPRAFKLLRQAGVVAGNAPPLGGRAHRSIEERIARMPTATEEGGMKRVMMGAPMVGPERAKTEALQRRLSQARNHPLAQHAPERVLEVAKTLDDSLGEVLARKHTPRFNSQADVHNFIKNFSSLSPAGAPEKSDFQRMVDLLKR